MQRPQLVRRGDEQHVREVERHFEVVIAEGVVLRRVEHLEQRRRRVALEAGGQLVHFVEHEHRVHGAGLFHRLHDASGQRADVGPSMPANFRFVADAAERNPHELAVHRARDRLAERGLADTWGADEAEDRPLHVALQLPDGQVLDDAVLDLVEVVVVLVEHSARLDGIEAIFGRRPPGHLEQPVEVRARHLVVGRRAADAGQPVQLACRDLVDVLGQVTRGDLFAQQLDLVGLALAELVLDRLELLPQVVLPLRVRHLLLRLRLDAPLHLEERDFARERSRDHFELGDEGVDLEHGLLLYGRHVEQAGDQVRQPQRVVDVLDDGPQLLRDTRGQRQRAVDLLAEAPHIGVHLDGLDHLFRRPADVRRHRLLGEADRLGVHPLEAFDDDLQAVCAARHLSDDADGAHLLEVRGARRFRIADLQRQEEQPIARQGTVHGVNRHRPVDRHRRHAHRERHHVPERQNGKR